MKPDRTNYEIWLIDYLDGTLDNDQVNILLSFLKENPDIKEEFEEFSQPVLSSDHSLFNKDILKKSVSDLPESQFEFLCVAASEGDLDEEQRAELETVTTADPEKRKTLELIKRLRLTPLEIKYDRKPNLKRLTVPQKIVRLSVIGVSAAAGIALMISLFNISGKPNDELIQSLSINSSAGLKEINAPVRQAAVENISVDKKEIRPADGISVQNKLIISDNVKTEDHSPELAVKKYITERPEILPDNISKTDFKQEVRLLEKEYTSSLVALNTTEISIPETPEQPGFNELIAKAFRERILKSKTPGTGTLKVYEVADASIIGLNKLLGWEMSLKQNRDERGDLKSLYFSSKIIKFNAPVKKVELAP